MIRSAFVLFAMLGLGSHATAAEPLNRFECDTPPGHFSFWSQSLVKPSFVATGAIKVNELRVDPRWHPVISIFVGPKGDAGQQYGVRLTTLASQPDRLFVEILEPGDSQQSLGAIPIAKGAISFEFRLEHDDLLVKVGDVEGRAKLGGFAREELSFGCSTADVEFTRVQIAPRR